MTNEAINEKRRAFLGASALVLTGAMFGVPAMMTTATAADYKQNPFGLVYDGAITTNEPGKV
ncbi:MAG: alpha/beta hydrolase, partial [Mesorhizobium sp.]